MRLPTSTMTAWTSLQPGLELDSPFILQPSPLHPRGSSPASVTHSQRRPTPSSLSLQHSGIADHLRPSQSLILGRRPSSLLQALGFNYGIVEHPRPKHCPNHPGVPSFQFPHNGVRDCCHLGLRGLSDMEVSLCSHQRAECLLCRVLRRRHSV